jgi:hypothetical protein
MSDIVTQAKADIAKAQAVIAASESPVLTFIKAHYTKVVYGVIGAAVTFLYKAL